VVRDLNVDSDDENIFESRDDMYLDEYESRGGVCDNGTKYEKAWLDGVMLRDHALKVVNAVNKSGTMAFVVDILDNDCANAYRIPVEFTKFDHGAETTTTHVQTWKSFDQFEFEVEMDYELDLSEIERMSNVLFIDVKPGRKARGKKGLYDVIMKALEDNK